jgi:hypothetical protein
MHNPCQAGTTTRKIRSVYETAEISSTCECCRSNVKLCGRCLYTNQTYEPVGNRYKNASPEKIAKENSSFFQGCRIVRERFLCGNRTRLRRFRTAKRFNTKAQGQRRSRATLGKHHAISLTPKALHIMFNTFGVTELIEQMSEGAPFDKLRATLGYGV